MLIEVGERHLARGDERRDAGEQADHDQQAEDELDQPGEPEGPGSGRHRGSERPAEQLYRAVQHVEQSEDDPEDAQRRGGEACQARVQVGSHRPDHTPRLAAFSQPDLMVTRPIRSRYRYERPDGANATRPFGRRGLHRRITARTCCRQFVAVSCVGVATNEHVTELVRLVGTSIRRQCCGRLRPKRGHRDSFVRD